MEFQNNHLEKNLEELAGRIIEKKNSPEYEGLSEKELIKEVLRPIVKEPAFDNNPPVQNQNPPTGSNDVSSFDSVDGLTPEAKIKVEKLINSVFKEGISKAVKEARNFDAFVLDSFHDALTDKLYDELKRKKLI